MLKIKVKNNREKEKIIMDLLGQYFSKMKETSALIDPIILSGFKESEGRIAEGDEIYQKLYEAALGRMGKPKMRSHIAVLGYEMCNDKDVDGFLPIAAAMDLLEFSYYCSDKIFDTDILGDHDLVKDKIIVSHILVSLVFKMIAESVKKLGFNNEQIIEINVTLYRFIRDIYEGFYIENHNKKPSKEIYEKRLYAYNYWEHILRISAVAAGADKEKVNSLSNFGKYIGMAYMVTNDIADITKDFEDIKNARYTLPNIIFLEKANDGEKELFKNNFGNRRAAAEDLKKIGQIMVDKKIINDCQSYASGFIEKSLPYLRVFGDSFSKKMLVIATRSVYKNQWYRAISEAYGFKRTVKPCDLELAQLVL